MEIQSHVADGTTNDSLTKRTNSSFAAELRICNDGLSAVPSDGPLKRLREPIVRLACAARRDNVTPEQMIVDLKTLLFRLPHFEIRRAIERGEMMHQLITVAINAYYARTDD